MRAGVWMEAGAGGAPRTIQVGADGGLDRSGGQVGGEGLFQELGQPARVPGAVGTALPSEAHRPHCCPRGRGQGGPESGQNWGAPGLHPALLARRLPQTSLSRGRQRSHVHTPTCKRCTPKCHMCIETTEGQTRGGRRTLVETRPCSSLRSSAGCGFSLTPLTRHNSPGFGCLSCVSCPEAWRPHS